MYVHLETMYSMSAFVRITANLYNIIFIQIICVISRRYVLYIRLMSIIRCQVILPNIVKPLNNSKYIYINCSDVCFILLSFLISSRVGILLW